MVASLVFAVAEAFQAERYCVRQRCRFLLARLAHDLFHPQLSPNLLGVLDLDSTSADVLTWAFRGDSN